MNRENFEEFAVKCEQGIDVPKKHIIVEMTEPRKVRNTYLSSNSFFFGVITGLIVAFLILILLT